MRLLSILAKFARSPQGQKAVRQAQRYASSPDGKAKIAQARELVANRGKSGAAPKRRKLR